ncbi:2og-fe oxygenase-like protein 2 [Dermatophagoides farinae]|uniref:2og-fe oxygenase-like protein 2 n=1 Tax=Dermatophagoides farinae TaxID=6954 RepID=A0A9D4SEE7_DERFA|nr:2-oxoglutarate and iron-dependent oxygenase domain-containing protein 3-like [Dermatophagoides farinae]KAH7639007.1 2og-fe oxygenase-like protein 2 [Dermatophagoides farinae]
MVQNNQHHHHRRRRNLLHNVDNKNRHSNDDDVDDQQNDGRQSINKDGNIIGEQNNSKQQQQQQHRSMNRNVFSHGNHSHVYSILSLPIWLRKIIISMSIMFIVYIYHHHYNNNNQNRNQLQSSTNITMASINDNHLGSPFGQFKQCSNDYEQDRLQFKSCTPYKCGRFVSDSIVNDNEALELRLFAQTIFTMVQPNGGVAIFDLASGALSNGTQFINLYKLLKHLPDPEKVIKQKIFDTFHVVRKKLLQTITMTFGIKSDHLYLTSPVFFTKINSKQAAKTLNDEYWHPHIDKFTYNTFHYTSLLYLATYQEEFSGGRFIFIDNDEKINNTIIEPKFGRISFFTSGSENQHMVEQVSNGERFALTIPFTCDPNKQVILPTTTI